jgi:Skp family chaperone for outer membrane proteins
MKKILFAVFSAVLFILAGENLKAQTLKVGVFDIDLMVQALPAYRNVDSLMQIYVDDSLATERLINEMEFARLDTQYKLDSALHAQGKKTKAMFDFTAEKRREVGLNLVYWQQIAQNKSNNKRSQLAQPLYAVVINAYKKILDKKKYTLILKPQSYEAGFAIDNIFLSVARELKLSELPQQLVGIGNDPDAVPAKQPAKPTGTKPK